ncbi:hypothetical protein LXL04_023813 [Taraxacum kok-saghyz]
MAPSSSFPLHIYPPVIASELWRNRNLFVIASELWRNRNLFPHFTLFFPNSLNWNCKLLADWFVFSVEKSESVRNKKDGQKDKQMKDYLKSKMNSTLAKGSGTTSLNERKLPIIRREPPKTKMPPNPLSDRIPKIPSVVVTSSSSDPSAVFLDLPFEKAFTIQLQPKLL